MMRRGTVLVVIGMTFVLSLGSGLAAPQALVETPLPLKIAYQSTSANDWLLFAAKDLRLFENMGVAPQYMPYEAGTTIIEAAKSKSIDMAFVQVVPFLIGLSEGVDWVMIGIYSEGAYSEGLVVPRDSGINTPGDLKGKRIGYYEASSAHYGLAMILRQYGISRDQVNLLHMSPDEQLLAMTRGEIDAAMVWEPWIQRMVHHANARVITTEGDLGIYTNVGGICVRREWLRDNRETAVRFIRALIMAYDALQVDNSVAVRAVAEAVGTKEEWAAQIYRNDPPARMHLLTDPRYPYSLVKGAAFHRRLGYLVKFMVDEKLFPIEVVTHDVLDVSVITEVLKTSGKGP